MTQLLGCIEPSQVLEEDYLAALVADTRPEFSQHLEKCDYCRNEVTDYRRVDNLMHQQFGFISSPKRALCPDSQKLGEYALGLLGSVEAAQVERHLGTCQYCPPEVADLRGWLGEPDPQLMSQPAGKPAFFQQLRKVVATLLNSGGQTNYALAGVRGSDEGLPQTYQAEEVSVTLTIQPVAPRSRELMVLGLVQRDNFPLEATAGAEVRLSESGRVLATETIDELGNFVFAQVAAPSHFDLEIALADKIVLVPNLSLV